MSDKDHHDSDFVVRRLEARHHPAELIFAILAFAFALILLSQLPSQTKWVGRASTFAQPAFWPAVSITGMMLFGVTELWFCVRRSKGAARQQILSEMLAWLCALEYMVWFLAYVWLVPLLGYLPATLLFCTTLTLRLGYRSTRSLAMAALVGSVTVVVFKGFLNVRIPGGAVYEHLPQAIRNFMLLYL